MKKVLLILGMAAVLAACTTKTQTPSPKTDTIVVVDSIITDSIAVDSTMTDSVE